MRPLHGSDLLVQTDEAMLLSLRSNQGKFNEAVTQCIHAEMESRKISDGVRKLDYGCIYTLPSCVVRIQVVMVLEG